MSTRRHNAPAGHKSTELGVIPEDWMIKSGDEIYDPVRGGSPRPAGDPRYFNGSFIPWLTVAALTNIPTCQMTVTETATCLTKEGSLHSRTLDPGTLIIANSGATLGVAKLLGIKCCANDGIAALLNLSKDVSAAYLAHFINTKTSYLRDVVATGNGQPNLNTGLIGRFKFPLPPTKAEQEAIAETLSDVDGLIEALEKLIAKKRAIKQAAMQQLLTGQTRLPGFSGEWRTSTFDELFGILRSANNSRADLSSEGDCGYLHYGDIHTHSSVFLDCGRELKTFIASNRVHGTPDMQDGDLVMVDASEDTDAIGKAVEITGLRGRKAVAGLHTILLRGRLGQLSDGFKGYLQYFAQVRHSLVRMATGVSVYGISKSAIKKIAVTIPDVEEQAAIAAVLSAMDAEITALERRRDKTKAIKQGMMQQLLTGRVRLLKPEAPAAKPEPLRKPANAPTWQLSEEVLISVLAKQFGSEKFPLGRMRRMKLTYLLRRHLEGQAQGYLKKAAGPYNPKSKYGGPETIALRKGYVREQKSGNLQGFVAGKNIAQADACFDEWYGPEARQWLEQFRLKKNEELELLATVDMAAEELREKGVEVSLATVKDVIQAGPEWKAKLARDVFSDRNIALAIDACRTLFG